MSTTDPLPPTDGHQDVGDQGEEIPTPDVDLAHVDVSDIEQTTPHGDSDAIS
jgi:hypothetical protein